ncbi:MAG: hypothetical protein ACRC3J_01825 [Culicoidibacterales bacterium]
MIFKPSFKTSIPYAFGSLDNTTVYVKVKTYKRFWFKETLENVEFFKIDIGTNKWTTEANEPISWDLADKLQKLFDRLEVKLSENGVTLYI